MGKRAPHIEGYVSVSEAIGELGSGFNPYSKTRGYHDKMVNLGGFIYFENKVFAEVKKNYKPGFPVKNNRRKFYFMDMNPLETILTLKEAEESGIKLMPVEADEALYDKGRRNGISGLVKDGTIEYETLNGQKCLSAGVVLNLIVRGYGKWKNFTFRLSQELLKYVVIPGGENEKLKLRKLVNETTGFDESSGKVDGELLGMDNLFKVLTALKTCEGEDKVSEKKPQPPSDIIGVMEGIGLKQAGSYLSDALTSEELKKVESTFSLVIEKYRPDKRDSAIRGIASLFKACEEAELYKQKSFLIKQFSRLSILGDDITSKNLTGDPYAFKASVGKEELINLTANAGRVASRWKLIADEAEENLRGKKTDENKFIFKF